MLRVSPAYAPWAGSYREKLETGNLKLGNGIKDERPIWNKYIEILDFGYWILDQG